MKAAASEIARRTRLGGEVRLLSRLSIDFLLDLIAAGRDGRHVLDALILTAIVQANVAEISRHADLQVAFAEAEAPPPDHMRRPISVNALAASLGQPFETIRRRVRRLLDDGLCVAADGGVIVPTAVLTHPRYLTNGFVAYERVRAFYYQLVDLELLGPLPAPSVSLPAGSFPVRALARLTSDYVLRIVETLPALADDLLSALIILEVFRANVAEFPMHPTGGDGLKATDMAPEAIRIPVSAQAVAARLGAPAETVRRRVQRLLKEGRLEQQRGGLLAPVKVLAAPEIRAVMTSHTATLERYLSSLSRLGVLRVWDAAR